MGLDRIARAFAAARAGKRAALMPYYTLGYPDLATSERVIAAIAGAWADLIELGIPFPIRWQMVRRSNARRRSRWRRASRCGVAWS